MAKKGKKSKAKGKAKGKGKGKGKRKSKKSSKASKKGSSAIEQVIRVTTITEPELPPPPPPPPSPPPPPPPCGRAAPCGRLPCGGLVVGPGVHVTRVPPKHWTPPPPPPPLAGPEPNICSARPPSRRGEVGNDLYLDAKSEEQQWGPPCRAHTPCQEEPYVHLTVPAPKEPPKARRPRIPKLRFGKDGQPRVEISGSDGDKYEEEDDDDYGDEKTKEPEDAEPEPPEVHVTAPAVVLHKECVYHVHVVGSNGLLEVDRLTKNHNVPNCFIRQKKDDDEYLKLFPNRFVEKNCCDDLFLLDEPPNPYGSWG